MHQAVLAVMERLNVQGPLPFQRARTWNSLNVPVECPTMTVTAAVTLRTLAQCLPRSKNCDSAFFFLARFSSHRPYGAHALSSVLEAGSGQMALPQ